MTLALCYPLARRQQRWRTKRPSAGGHSAWWTSILIRRCVFCCHEPSGSPRTAAVICVLQGRSSEASKCPGNFSQLDRTGAGGVLTTTGSPEDGLEIRGHKVRRKKPDKDC